MKSIIIFLILLFLATSVYAGAGQCVYGPGSVITHYGDFACNKEEQKKIEKMTEQERESYFLNKWFDETEKENT